MNILLLNSNFVDDDLTSNIYNYAKLKQKYPDLKLVDKSNYNNENIIKYDISYTKNIDCLHILRKIDYILYQLYVIRELIHYYNLDKTITYQDVIELFNNKKDFPDYLDITNIKDQKLNFFANLPFYYWKIHEFVTNKMYFANANFYISDEETLNFIMGSGVHFKDYEIKNQLIKLKDQIKINNNFSSYVIYKKNKPNSSKTILGKFLFQDNENNENKDNTHVFNNENKYNFIDQNEFNTIKDKEFNLILVDDISCGGESTVGLFDIYFYKNDNLKDVKINIYLIYAYMTNRAYNGLIEFSNNETHIEYYTYSKNVTFNIINNTKYLSPIELAEKYKFNHLKYKLYNSEINSVYFSDYGKNVVSNCSYYPFVNYCSKIPIYSSIIIFDFDFTITDGVRVRPYLKELVDYLRSQNVLLLIWTYREIEKCDEFFYKVINDYFGDIKIYYQEDTINDKKDLLFISRLYVIDDVTIIDDRDDLLFLGWMNEYKHIHIKGFYEEMNDDREFLKILDKFKE